MGMKNWAEKEVELACKRENPDWDGESFDYGCYCYMSALKAYNSLLEDDHSGMSWSITKNILIRLINGQPLEVITDEDFVLTENSILEPEEYLKEHHLKSSIQCPRMSSLFRDETLDGKVTYNDVDRYYCFEVDDEKNTYQGCGASTILNELFPISMPYYPPSNKYKICCDTFLVDEKNGDFDTRGYLYIITPEGDKVVVNRFYKTVEVGDPQVHKIGWVSTDDKGEETEHEKEVTYQPTEWVEISKEEFYELKKRKIR